jgi:toxin ParE1/3/4
MKIYELSKNAEAELEKIGRYSWHEWEFEQMETYINGLHRQLENLAKNPRLGRERNELLPDLRSFKYEKHILFYSETDKGILVAHILHHAQDVQNYFA